MTGARPLASGAQGLDPWLLLVAAAACWGVGTAVSKQAVADIPAVTLLAVQLAVSVAGLTIVGRVRGERLSTRPGEAAIARLGLLNPGLAYALGLLGLTQISASVSVLIWAGEPVLILLLAALLLREALPRWLVVLSGVSLAGLVVVLTGPALTGDVAGIAVSVLGVLCCAIYTVATRRWISGADSTLAVVLGQQTWALVLALGLVAVTVLAGGTVVPGSITIATVLSAAISGLLYYAIAYWLYLGALRRLPASIAATSFFVIPLFGLAAAGLFGERLAVAQWLGAGVVIVAVAGIGWFQRRTAAALATG